MECCRGLAPESECACAKSRIVELEAALRHAVEIAEAKITGTWDDLLPYRKLLDQK